MHCCLTNNQQQSWSNNTSKSENVAQPGPLSDTFQLICICSGIILDIATTCRSFMPSLLARKPFWRNTPAPQAIFQLWPESCWLRFLRQTQRWAMFTTSMSFITSSIRESPFCVCPMRVRSEESHSLSSKTSRNAGEKDTLPLNKQLWPFRWMICSHPSWDRKL